MVLSIPYEYFNGKQLNTCCTEYLTIDVSDFNLCGDKYFELRLVSITTADTQVLSTFSYNNNLYGTTSLSPDDLIELLATAFVCPPSNCDGQEASFDWELNPFLADKWVSTTIVNSVSSTNVTYSVNTLTVNSVGYGVLPHVFWTDSVDGNASTHTFDYIEALIEYIESLNIPEYVGAINLAKNGMENNLSGVGLLELYFQEGVTVSITITAPSPVISGTFTGGTTVTTNLTLAMTNTSTMASGDVLSSVNYIVSDGQKVIGSTIAIDTEILVYSIFCKNCNINPNNYWILNNVLITQNGCATNNLSTGYITPTQIQTVINSQTPDTGSSIA